MRDADPLPAEADRGVEAALFVRRHTRVARAPLVPELELYLAEAVVPLWEATERRAGAPQAPPFWAFAWPGSQVLARWLLDHPTLASGRPVLDLGAGGGLAALAALRAGAARAIACDIDPLAGVAQRLNAALNGLFVCDETAVPPHPAHACLTVVCADAVGTDLGGDLVLAGDVCYERQQARPMLDWLRHLAARGSTVLLAEPGRRYAPADGFDLLASFEVPTLTDLESAVVRHTRLLRLRPQA